MTPLVTIGLPVRNGEAYLAEAIESALAQTFSGFELIISDNASTDGTWQICRAYERRDGRINLRSNNCDMGASYNHNRVLRLARGRYFKWLAHDDIMYPCFLEMSIAALEAHPGATLAYSAVDIIDGTGVPLYRDPALLQRAQAGRPPERFADVILIPHNCLAVFGLMRTDVLRCTQMIGSYDGADRALLAELALMGRFTYVDSALFSNRDHAGRYIRAVRPQPHTSISWWDTSAPATTMHYWRLYRSYHRAVRQHVAPGRDRLACRWHLLRWLLVDWHCLHLAVDAAGALDPRVFMFARQAKQRLFPPRGGPIL